MAAYPSPTPGASLLLAFRRPKFAIIGSNTLAASRAFVALEADSDVVVFSKGGLDSACPELQWRAKNNQVTIVDLDSLPGPSTTNEALDSYLSVTKGFQLACITDTLLAGPDASQPHRSESSAVQIARVFRFHNIPLNVVDLPHLCDFTFTSTHRFIEPATSLPTPLQIGVTTNGQGCRLASRFRREIVAALPKDAGAAVSQVGRLRSLAKESVVIGAEESVRVLEEGTEATPNAPVPQRTTTETDVESARRRMRWVAQISEYWPVSKLANITETETADILDAREGLSSIHTDLSANKLSCHAGDSEVNSLHGLSITPPTSRGRIFLVGSGPGHPSLLTLATHAALTKHANLVLSDKLVPAAVLELIPKHVEVRIARKFPGNADGAQNELMEATIEAANRGLTVVRLKQGDPTVYGRAGEEVLFFRTHGYEATVIPGVSSVLAGPVFAGIPVTQRGAAESFIVCTGVGRQGKEVKLPGYERSRTLVLLMGVARLPQILDTLLSDGIPLSRRGGTAYPAQTPIALIERASMPDQRVLYSTLKDIGAALESLGEQRPPGMLVIGWSVLSLWEGGDVSVLDGEAEKNDGARIKKWLKGERWRVSEGLELGWEEL